MDTPDEALDTRLQPLMNWLFCEPNPIAINTTLMMTAAVAPIFRMPYKALTKVQREQGLALLSALSQDERVGDKLNLMADEDFHYSY